MYICEACGEKFEKPVIKKEMLFVPYGEGEVALDEYRFYSPCCFDRFFKSSEKKNFTKILGERENGRILSKEA